MNNCLYPAENSGKKSVIQVVLNINNNIIQQNSKLTLTSHLINLINKNNDIKPAFNLLISIRGIGDKIASFFLRDLVDVMNINLTNQTQNRNLLQPIDVWVKRTISILASNQNMGKNQIANWIVQTSNQNNVNPERINMGIWFFCSNIIGSEYRLNTTLRNPNNATLRDTKIAQNLVNDFRNSIRDVCQHC